MDEEEILMPQFETPEDARNYCIAMMGVATAMGHDDVADEIAEQIRRLDAGTAAEGMPNPVVAEQGENDTAVLPGFPLLVSRSTTIKSNVEIYTKLMTDAGLTEIVSTERNEDYGSVFVIYGKATADQLRAFARQECHYETNHGILAR